MLGYGLKFGSHGGSIDRTREKALSEVISHVQCDIAANLTASWDGSAQTIADLENNVNFYRGGNGTVSTDDPSLSGTAGDAAARFSFDGGDHLTETSHGNLLKTLHQGAHTIIWTGNIASYATRQEFFRTTDTSSFDGMQLWCSNSAGTPQVSSTFALGGAVFGANPLTFGTKIAGDNIAVCWTRDPASNQYRIYVGGETSVTTDTSSWGASATNSQGAAVISGAITSSFARFSNGTLMGSFAVRNVATTESDWNTIILPQLELRDGVTYT